jgi:peptidoglycan hydrolase-like protein with peptidoglycan-binding domain
MTQERTTMANIHPTIKQGSHGTAVKLAQRRLVARGYSPLAQDGIFGGQTKQRVRAYQTDRSHDTVQPLPVDGIVGAKTWARLDPPTIEEGATGDAVKLLQHLLSNFGFTVAVDGQFGAATKAALVEFQTWFGLEPDGIAGPLTWTALWS